MKKLKDISWEVDEPTYRSDKALSYSTLSRYLKEGFNKLDTLFDKIESPSLTFGSAVDTYITDGKDAFEQQFAICDFPAIKDSVKQMVDALFNNFAYDNIEDIPTGDIIALTEELKFQLNWKPETRARVIKEQGIDYYNALVGAKDKTVLSIETGNAVFAAVRALKESPATKFYFADNDPFNQDIVREYQLKFKATFENVDYRCMADLLLTDHRTKTVIPIDLKTSSHTEWDFPKSFVEWRYHLQARLYWRIIRHCMDLDDFFRDYTLDDYRFIVVNKETLCPLVWRYPDTKTTGTLYYGKNDRIECPDPFVLGKELDYYLKEQPTVPININVEQENELTEWLKKL